ncbi:MAG: hypothetical protein AAB731_00660, partial [Patescibacteria group bacterium]
MPARKIKNKKNTIYKAAKIKVAAIFLVAAFFVFISYQYINIAFSAKAANEKDMVGVSSPFQPEADPPLEETGEGEGEGEQSFPQGLQNLPKQSQPAEIFNFQFSIFNPGRSPIVKGYLRGEHKFRVAVLAAMSAVGNAYENGAQELSGAVKDAVLGIALLPQTAKKGLGDFSNGIITGAEKIKAGALALYDSATAESDQPADTVETQNFASLQRQVVSVGAGSPRPNGDTKLQVPSFKLQVSNLSDALLVYGDFLRQKANAFNQVVFYLPESISETAIGMVLAAKDGLADFGQTTKDVALAVGGAIKSAANSVGRTTKNGTLAAKDFVLNEISRVGSFGSRQLASLKCNLRIGECPAVAPEPPQSSPADYSGGLVAQSPTTDNISENPLEISGNPIEQTIKTIAQNTAKAPVSAEPTKLSPSLTSATKPTIASASETISQSSAQSLPTGQAGPPTGQAGLPTGQAGPPTGQAGAKISEIGNLKINGDLTVVGAAVFGNKTEFLGDIAMSAATFKSIKVNGVVDFTGAIITGLPASQVVNNYYGGGSTIVTAAGVGSNISGQYGRVAEDFSVGRNLSISGNLNLQNTSSVLTNYGATSLRGPISVYAGITPSADATFSLGSPTARFANVFSQGLSVTTLSVGVTSSTGAQSIVASVPTGAVLNLQNTSSAASTARTLRMTDYGGSKYFDMWYDGTDFRMETSAGSGADIYIHPDGGQVYFNTDIIVSGGNAMVSSTGRANFAYDPATNSTPSIWLSSNTSYDDAKTYLVINPTSTVSFDNYLHFKQGSLDRLKLTASSTLILYPDNAVGLVISASSTQTANLLELKNYAGRQMTLFDPSGDLYFGSGATTSTIGFATSTYIYAHPKSDTAGYSAFTLNTTSTLSNAALLSVRNNGTQLFNITNASSTFAKTILSTSQSGYTPNIQFSATGTMF